MLSEDLGLLFAFPDQSASFVHGFEAGMLWARIEAGEAVIDCGFEEGFPLHTDNLELVLRMAAVGSYATAFIRLQT
jgi:hypothetical protein